MKILVVSDTHREMDKMRLAVESEQPDMLLHLGDHDADAMELARLFPNLEVCCVCGNCDGIFSDSPLTFFRQIEGVRVFAAHGHKYNVKNGLLRFTYGAMEAGAQVALFGHTHCPYCEEMSGLWLMNPGSCKGYRASYGLVEIQNGSVSCRIVEGNL